MQTLSSSHVCPSCNAAYPAGTNYCGKCGADMRPSPAGHHGRTDSNDDYATDASVLYRRHSDTPAEDDRWLGRVIDGRYRVLERIGQGAMGAVYKIVHERMGKIAAMKVLHRELSSEREVVRRFRREAEAVSRLSHPNTVQVFDFGAVRGALYLVMEYVSGQDLGSIIRRDGPAPLHRAATILYQICMALAEAHSLGIVHRDLKPENVLLTRTRDGADFIKVLDFGLAKLSEREELADVTDAGSIVGTPYYLSPEQIRGESVDTRADIYSLGALMYRVITGEPPFRAQTPMGVLTKHLTAELVLPSARRPDLQIDPRVDAIVARAMQKPREARYASVDELREDIEAVYCEITGEPALPFAHSGGHRRGAPFQADRAASAHPVDVALAMQSDRRLNREDIDHFEQKLRRRRWLRLVGVPLIVIGGACAAVYHYGVRAVAPRSAEREPNNEPDDATVIRSGAPVSGYLGRRLSPTEPDKDCYRLNAIPAADGSQRVTIHVTSLPNIDIVVQLYEATGKFITKGDAGGVGIEEWIRNHRVNAPFLVVVTESSGGRLPTENVSDAYTLTVTLQDADASTEVEPNDGDGIPTPIHPDSPLTGFLDRRGDVDRFRFAGSAGLYQLTISGADGVPLQVRIADGPPHTTRAMEVPLVGAEVITIERNESDSGSRAVASAAKPYRVMLRTLAP
jgi:eukaryotic-like serine/threonine-protein kinase